MRIAAVTTMLILPLLFVSSTAVGQPRDAGSAAAAQKLFEEGRALVTAGKNAEACPKFAASQRLDPGAGTLLNLGECYEKIDKLASAWATYREAETVAQRAGQRERATYCATRAQSLSDKLSYLTIQVPSGSSRPAGLSIRRDGEVIPEVVWATAVPVDGGAHTIEASAPGHRAWKGVVNVKASGDREKIVVPDLEKLPPESTATAPSGASPIERTIGWTAVGVGAATLVTGLVFGAIAKSRNDEANSADHCTAIDCDERGLALLRDANDASKVATILVLAGTGIAIGGVVLVLTAPTRNRAATSTSFTKPPTRVGAFLRSTGMTLDLTW